MKRLIALMLVILLLTGCAFSGNKMKDPVTYYYLRSTIDSNDYDDFYAEGIINSEKREASGRSNDLEHMLTVYFRGPLDQQLVSPFPPGSRIWEMQQNEDELTLLLNTMLAEKSDLQITIACACLAKTCLDLTDVNSVRIEARNLEDKLLFTRTFTRDNLFLYDDYNQSATDAENTQ